MRNFSSGLNNKEGSIGDVPPVKCYYVSAQQVQPVLDLFGVANDVDYQGRRDGFLNMRFAKPKM